MAEHRSPKSVVGGSSPSWPARFFLMKGKENFITKAKNFLNEVKSEMKRVTWPTTKEVVGTTIVVIITVIFFSVYLYLCDIIFAWIINNIRAFFGG